MTKKTSIIFTAFFVFAFVGVIFIYFYRVQIDGFINNYISQITICENITDENECFSKGFCEGIYTSSCPECNDLVFQQCQRMPKKVAVEFINNKKICQETEGQWYRNKLGSFCLCKYGKVFDKDLGCVIK